MSHYQCLKTSVINNKSKSFELFLNILRSKRHSKSNNKLIKVISENYQVPIRTKYDYVIYPMYKSIDTISMLLNYLSRPISIFRLNNFENNKNNYSSYSNNRTSKRLAYIFSGLSLGIILGDDSNLNKGNYFYIPFL